MLELRITARRESREERIETLEAVLGRSSRCDVTVRDLAMSRRHLRLVARERLWYAEDLGSRNGTFVNGRQIEEPVRITVGDVLTVGATVLEVLRAEVPSLPGGSPGPSSTHLLADADADADAEPDGERAGPDGSPAAETLLRPVEDLLEESARHDALQPEAEGTTLGRTVARLRMLNEIHNALGRSVDVDELLELILERAFDHLEPEHGVILLKDASGEYARAAARGTPPAPGPPTSQSLIREVAEKGLAALVLDTRTDRRFSASDSLVSAGIRSLLAAPLLSPDGPLGLVILACNAAVRQFTEEDLALLVSLASVAALRLHNVRLAEAAAARQQLVKELELARRIQTALFPEQLPEVPGYRLDASNLPSRGVSGDLYIVVERPTAGAAAVAGTASGIGEVIGERTTQAGTVPAEQVLMVADVSGKGLSASLLTASIEALAVGPIEIGLEPEVICARLAEQLHRRTPPERFATAFLAVLEPISGRVRYANAGHNPALVARTSGAVEWLEATGMPLGLIDGFGYEQAAITLDPGDLLLIYTDGLTEAFNADNEEYGEARLAELVTDHRREAPGAVIQAVTADIDRHAGEAAAGDDRTMVVLQRLPGPDGP